MSIFDINPDIRYAETLSSEFYTDERYFRESKEKIFARSWQMVGRADEIDNLKPLKILVEEKCQANGIRCGYHGRRFHLDGKFLSMPEFDGAANFPSAKDDLPKI